MKKNPRYQGLLIARHTTYLAADGSPLEKQPEWEERLMDAMKPEPRFMLVELYTKVGEVSGNTKRELYETSSTAAFRDKLYFDEIYITSIHRQVRRPGETEWHYTTETTFNSYPPERRRIITKPA